MLESYELGQKIIRNVVDKCYCDNNGFYFLYDLIEKSPHGYINTNDLGDYVPYLHHYGCVDEICNNLKAVLSKYDVLYQDNVERFGAGRLSKYGVADLYSNSDYLHGLLFALRRDEYKDFHGAIRDVMANVITLLTKTTYSNFYGLGKWFLPVPLFRPIDMGMYPELFVEYGEYSLAKIKLRPMVERILRTRRPLARNYVLKYPVSNDQILMKDHTNLMFSYISYYKKVRKEFDRNELKQLTAILIDNFSVGDVLVNSTKTKDLAEPLCFAFLDILLDSFLLTEDMFYLEQMERFFPFWLDIIDTYKIVPTRVNYKKGTISDISIVDTNTDFYVFFKKLNLFFGDKYVTKEWLGEYRNIILDRFLCKESYDVFSSYNISLNQPRPVVKSKFSTLFTKIFIVDGIQSQHDYFESSEYLDDR